MLVKCCICGNKIDRKDAYRLTKNNVNHYYCSSKEYDEFEEYKETKAKVLSNIELIFGYKITNSALYKELSEFTKQYSYRDILYYLNDNQYYLKKVMTEKTFTSEYASIRYFMAILRNNIPKYAHVSPVSKEVSVEIPNMKFARKNKRIPLVQYEEGDALSESL